MYITAIETGSCSADGQQWATRNTEQGGKDLCVCGKRHRTYDSAARCMDKLRDDNDASWLSACIHDECGHRVGPHTGTRRGRAAAEAAAEAERRTELRAMAAEDKRLQAQEAAEWEAFDRQEQQAR